jgi:pullulanase-type alpha-1,6-glucosidase
MSWLRRSSIVLFALSASAVAGCGDDGGTQGPRPDAGLYDDAAPAPDAPASFVANAEAHWVTRNTIAIPTTLPGDRFELHHAPDGGIALEDGALTGGTALILTVDEAGLPEAVTAKFPHLAGYKALALAETDATQVSEILAGQLVLVGLDTSGAVQAATSVQIPGVLDDLYAAAAAAPEVELGVTFADTPLAKTPTFRLWAPTARKVTLKVYAAADKAEVASEVMTRDDATGVWSYAATDESWYGNYYRYEVEVFAPRANPGDTTTAPGEVVVNLVTDPYSLGLSTNSQYSLIVNLDDEGTKPTGWDAFTPPDNFEAPEDIVLYEVHLRDFSVSDETVTNPAHRGKYLAFTYNGVGARPLSDGMAHLQRLSQVAVAGNPDSTLQGITHVHLLPVFDIATINEDANERIDIDVAGSVAALCERLDDVVPAVSCSEDATKAIREVLEALLEASGAGAGTRGDTEEIQALVDSVRGYDGYNWGYDPFHYTTPEGSYATNPEGVTRILEFRAMVMGLGAIDLRTVMDVVYNHTKASGQDDQSVLDKIVPGYYHRQNAVNGSVEKSTCCENTASEHAMMEKLMIDSAVTWASQYKIAGFRFDLMGHHMKSNMLKVQAALKAVDPKFYVYGEGWDFGEVVSGARGENATQQNLAGTEIGTFSDRLRDGVRGGGPFDSGADLRKKQGFINGMFYDPNEANTDTADVQKGKLLDQTDLISLGLAANLKEFVLTRKDGKNVIGADVDYNGYDAGYTLDPADEITYVAAHDNQTLFDNNQYKAKTGTTMEDRTRMQVLGLGITILAQGIPFLHMGEDILRSKSMARDSYDYGDWFNRVDFSYPENADATNNWNVGLPPKEKDESSYPIIRTLLEDTSIAPRAANMALSHAMTRELLFIRRESPLFRLTTAEDVKKRMDFHNVGPAQVPGFIVMTITDGTCAGVDLDDGKDNVAVFINATDDLQTFTATDTPLGGKLWVLHRAIETGSDPRAPQMSFESDVFSVPARSIAVFLDLQSGARDAGICNTKVAEDVPPPGGDVSKDVYIRGTLTDPQWDGLDYKFAKVAEGRYEVAVTGLAAGSYQFKVADDSWSTHNWGGSTGNPVLAPGGNLTLATNGANINLTITTAGDYTFILDTTNLEAPVLSLEAQ